MASLPDIQLSIDSHYIQCIKALQSIAMLTDENSEEHRIAFRQYYDLGDTPTGWRIAEKAREVANDVIGRLPLSKRIDNPRGFWCEFNERGQCLDLVEGSPCKCPEPGYVWIQEDVDGLAIYKAAMDSMAEQFIHLKTTGLQMAMQQLGLKGK